MTIADLTKAMSAALVSLMFPETRTSCQPNHAASRRGCQPGVKQVLKDRVVVVPGAIAVSMVLAGLPLFTWRRTIHPEPQLDKPGGAISQRTDQRNEGLFRDGSSPVTPPLVRDGAVGLPDLQVLWALHCEADVASFRSGVRRLSLTGQFGQTCRIFHLGRPGAARKLLTHIQAR